MPLFMDVHEGLGDATPDDIQAAHQRDLAVQHKHGCRFLTYWFNDPDGKVFCLFEAPDQATAVACHKEAHGLVPHRIVEVTPPTLASFMGGWERSVPDRARVAGPGTLPDSGLRAIMFTDIEGSTDISTRDGDARAVQVVRAHDDVVRRCLANAEGRVVKHTGDGILACFGAVTRAIDCAIAIQRALADPAANHGFRVRIGLSAGEPVAASDDLFGAAVNLAARVCARANGGQVLASSAVKDLAIGKAFDLTHLGAEPLKGFDQPVDLYEVRWR